MGLHLDQVTAVSRSVVQEHGRDLQVSGVTFSDGSADRVEVIVTIDGCHSGSCRFAVNVTRADSEEFERDFRVKLGEALRKHQAD
jgi:hypothetical protein